MFVKTMGSARAGPSTYRKSLMTRAQGFASTARTGKEKLVVLGSGWAGYNVARQVDKTLYDVTVVSPRSHFSFTPFLASAAVGTLEFRCTTEPVRGIKHVNYAQGWANGIDFDKQQVEVEPSIPAVPDFKHDLEVSKQVKGKDRAIAGEHYTVGYDKLVIAVGCYSQDFGIPGVAEHAHFLKDVNDSRAIRMRLLEMLEQASLPDITPEQRRALLHIAVVGGGPTGVEFSAEVHDFVEQDVYRMYPHLKGEVKITLYDVAPHILGSFDESLREYAEKKFARDGVAVRGGSQIKAVGKDWLELDGGKREPFGLLVWNTGLAANPLMAKLKGISHDEKTQSIHVSPYLQPLTEGADPQPIPNVFAIGDNALPLHGGRLPATAQVASQMASWVSKTLKYTGKGGRMEDKPAFVWKNRGSMVFVGDYRALVDRSSKTIEGIKSRLSGPLAWFLWRSYYMTLAMSWRNKALVPVYWTLAFFFGRDITRF